MIVGDVKEKQNDIACKCIVCGDSAKNASSKRMHLYTKESYEDRGIVRCFNGDCEYSASLYTFIKEYSPSLLSGYIAETGNKSLETLENEEMVVMRSKKVTPKVVKGKDLFEVPTEFLELNSNGNLAHKYLEQERGLDYEPEKYGKWYYCNDKLMVGGKEIYLKNKIIIPLYEDGSFDKYYGFYSRSLDQKFFHTFIPDNNSGYKIWNWCNIDRTKPVYIFEAIFDAISSGLDNCIAILGSSIDKSRIRELNEPIFVYDCDKTGIIKSKKMAEKHKVFIWPSSLKTRFGEKLDLNMLLKKGVTKEQLSQMIIKHTYSGVEAIVKLELG